MIAPSLITACVRSGLECWLSGASILTVTNTGDLILICCALNTRHSFHHPFFVNFQFNMTGALMVSNAAVTVLAKKLHRLIFVTRKDRFSRILTTDESI